MAGPCKPVAFALFLLVAATLDAHAGPKRTVCTITVNSSDEKDLLRRRLPADAYDFVELVEAGRPDWLASACRAGIRCDALVISGHFDGGTEFYSDRLDVRESLPVEALERASCSASCPGVFSHLKEVYLFGCNTLDGQATRSASPEIARSLVRAGHSPEDAQRIAQQLAQRYAESNRDRMREIFRDVPVLYGFSSKAPLGPSAAETLERYFHAGGAADFGSGRASERLLNLFASVSMTVASGMTDGDPNIAHRRAVCRLADDRLTTAQKIDFVHEVLRGDAAEVRMFLDHLEAYAAQIDQADRAQAQNARELADIEGDTDARTRYLAFARDADEPAVRARMLELAAKLGWLTKTQLHAELRRMLVERLAADQVGPAEVDLACALNSAHELEAAGSVEELPASTAGRVPQAAVRACLGSAPDRARVLRAVSEGDERGAEIAEVYLDRRPLADPREVRELASAVVRMNSGDAQVRALQTLSRQKLSDPVAVEQLAQLFAKARTPSVQRAIASLLLHSDYDVLARPEWIRAFRDARLRSSEGPDPIDVLIRRLQS